MSIESLLGESYRGVFRSLVTVRTQQGPLDLQHLGTLERQCSQPKPLNCLCAKWFPPLPA